MVIALSMANRSVKTRISTLQYLSFYGHVEIWCNFRKIMKIWKFSKKAEGSARPNPRPFSDFSEKMLKNENGAKFQNGH